MARLSIMDRLLIALGPPFSEKLPKAPTNDTLATVPTPINITAEPCPYKYKVRCCVFFCSKGQYHFPYPVFLRNLFVFFLLSKALLNTTFDYQLAEEAILRYIYLC